MTGLSAYLFAGLAGVLVLFQLSLALGAPWGHLSMGGRFPGRYPGWMRGVAVANATLLVVLALVVLHAADVQWAAWPRFADWAIWAVVTFSVLATLANLATPSRGERLLWAPVAALMLASSVLVALG